MGVALAGHNAAGVRDAEPVHEFVGLSIDRKCSESEEVCAPVSGHVQNRKMGRNWSHKQSRG